MSEYRLPSDGSVLVIEDRVNEALPLMQLLSQNGTAFTYYSGDDKGLPDTPTQKVRLAFVDIQLFEFGDSKSYVANILRLLDRLIPEKNGPYILIVWSRLEDVHGENLQTEVMSSGFPKRPVIFMGLKKADYFIREDESGERVDEVLAKLKGIINDEQLLSVKEVLLTDFGSTNQWRAKPNALQLISNALKERLDQADAFYLFTIWEDAVRKASGKAVESFGNLYAHDAFWQSNLRSGICRMAHAQLGQTIESADGNDLIKNALRTLNLYFLGELENEIGQIADLSHVLRLDGHVVLFTERLSGSEYQLKWDLSEGKYFLSVDNSVVNAHGVDDFKKLASQGRNQAEKDVAKKLIEDYSGLSPHINSRLLIDPHIPSYLQPGNLYKIEVADERKKTLLGSYFKKGGKVIARNGDCALSVGELNEITFVELEITPLCDFSQNKWLKSRFLPGILVPEMLVEALPSDREARESCYTQIPVLIIQGNRCKPVFDFRLLKSCDIEGEQDRRGTPICRFRSEVCADIQSRLSSHASRVGVTFVE
jgi:hypothetical protein